MTIEQLIASANQQKDFNAATLFKRILNTAKINNISINEAITYLISKETKKYNLNLLKLAEKYFPALDNKYIKHDSKLCKLNVQSKKIRLYIRRNIK